MLGMLQLLLEQFGKKSGYLYVATFNDNSQVLK
jgi:hypothetical protein